MPYINAAAQQQPEAGIKHLVNEEGCTGAAAQQHYSSMARNPLMTLANGANDDGWEWFQQRSTQW